MTDRLVSLVRDTAALNTAFEPLYYFTQGPVPPGPPAKRGVVLIDTTLAEFGVANADQLVAWGYHVGFLDDDSDAALAYALPNAALRAALVAAGLDTAQKLIDRTSAVNFSDQTPKIDGTLEGMHWLANLSSYMYLDTNEIGGAIPPEIGNLSSVTRLRLYGNALESSIPSELGNMGAVTQMYLQDNQLNGVIPPGLGNLGNVTHMQLHDNELSGEPPAELGNLSNLVQLYLYNNQLTSWPEMTIPTSVANSWRDIRVQGNLMATAATGVDRIITQVGISQQANPRTSSSTLNVSGTNMAEATWGTAAEPSDVAYSMRVLTYPGSNWSVSVRGGADAFVDELLPDLDYKYPLTQQYTGLTPAEVHLTTTAGSARLHHDTIDLTGYAKNGANYMLACYDSEGRAAYAFGGDSIPVDDGVELVSTAGGTTRDMIHVHTSFDANDIVKINIHSDGSPDPINAGAYD